MAWEKRGKYRNFSEYILDVSGKSIDEIVNSGSIQYSCPGIDKAAKIINDAIRDNRYIGVITDYDADGINSAAEMYMLLKKMGIKMSNLSIIIPRRFSDGYGINERMIDELPAGTLVITVDNGIAAIDPIRKAKEKGMTVIVMDHHLSGETKPNADLIIDPEDSPEGWTFHGYCGAGLVYKLAEYLYPKDKKFLDEMSVFAMTATIGDCVDVKSDGRNIILRGLNVLNNGPQNEAMLAISDKLRQDDKVEEFTEYEIAYKVAPMMNAPGRLKDDGGKYVVSGLFSTGDSARKFADDIFDINKKRKELVKNAEEMYQAVGDRIQFLYIPNFEEGLCGILAGRICNETHLPTFVMTDTQDGIVKGSARSESNANVFEMMNTCGSLFVKKGGHAQAAGFSLEKKNLEALQNALEKAAPDIPEDVSYYDFEADVKDLEGIFSEMNRIAVFGEGLEKPVIKVTTNVLSPKYIGTDKTHLSFQISSGSKRIKAIGFSLAEKYAGMSMPRNLVMYGTISQNIWMGRKSMQFQVEDIEGCEVQ